MASNDDGQVIQVNAASDISIANHFARHIENAEAKRRGTPVDVVRPVVARRLGVAPGTLENIRRQRSKVVPNWLMARIRAAFVAELQSEIGRLEHEIHLYRQTGVGPGDDALVAAQSQLGAAKTLLEG